MVFMVMLALPAWAWDADGHRVTGLLAQRLLEPEVDRHVKKLLGDMTLASATTWMDRERKQLGEPYAKWHYDNRPVCAKQNNIADYCRDDQCLSVQLRQQLTVLANKKLDNAQRRRALLFIAHMIGDLHQPFHAADHNDRGGNQLFVVLARGERKTIENLHKYWDDIAPEMAAKGERSEAFAKRLLQKYRDNHDEWTTGTTVQWQADSFELAKQFGYGNLPEFSCTLTRDRDAFILSDDYHKKAAEVAELQLAKAGFRLAAVLNQTLGE